MATLSITKSYAAGQILAKSNLDDIESAIETFLNTTKLGHENVDIDSTFNSLTQSQAETILNTGGYGTLVTTTLGADQALTSSYAAYNSVTVSSAGVYLVNAIALVELSPQVPAGFGPFNLEIGLYNVTDSSYIISESVLTTKIQAGSSESSNIFQTRKQCIQYVYPVTLTAGSVIAFRARKPADSSVVGTLKQNSVIQIYRIRSS